MENTIDHVRPNFCSTTTATMNATKFNEVTQFQEYDHFEKYDPNGSYVTTTFSADYGKGVRKYRNEAYIIYLENQQSPSEQPKCEAYIVAEEKVSQSEIKELAPYCQCNICTASRFRPTFTIGCPCCIGCLKSESPGISVINKTRKYRENMNKYTHLTTEVCSIKTR